MHLCVFLKDYGGSTAWQIERKYLGKCYSQANPHNIHKHVTPKNQKKVHNRQEKIWFTIANNSNSLTRQT